MLQVKLENPALFTGIAMIMWCVRSVRATHHAANNILACAVRNSRLASVARQQSHSLFRERLDTPPTTSSLRSRANNLILSSARFARAPTTSFARARLITKLTLALSIPGTLATKALATKWGIRRQLGNIHITNVLATLMLVLVFNKEGQLLGVLIVAIFYGLSIGGTYPMQKGLCVRARAGARSCSSPPSPLPRLFFCAQVHARHPCRPGDRVPGLLHFLYADPRARPIRVVRVLRRQQPRRREQ
jgi:hypothetical protein